MTYANSSVYHTQVGIGGEVVNRVPRNTLSRHRVIEAAVALVDAQGLEALTMPALAEQLGVGTMSLYRHMPGKDELIDLMMDTIMGEQYIDFAA